MFEVEDNFLSQEEYVSIYDLLTSDHFPWYFNNYKSSPIEKQLFNYQLELIHFIKTILLILIFLIV